MAHVNAAHSGPLQNITSKNITTELKKMFY